MNVSFRLATPDDALNLSRFGAEAFTDWYLPDNNPADVHLHVQETYSPTRQAAEIAEAGQVAMLAEVDGQLAGYSLLRTQSPCPGLERPNMAEIRRFYVARPWHGTGLAKRLMQAVTTQAERMGAFGVWLTCWERNPRALSFYAKSGFERVGLTTFTVGTDVQTDHLLARNLSLTADPARS